MNTLASDVITKQQDRKRMEDDNLARYEMEKEMRARMADEQRMLREQAEKAEMRKLLAQQMDEKRMREAAERALNDEQAVIWKKDKENYELEE